MTSYSFKIAIVLLVLFAIIKFGCEFAPGSYPAKNIYPITLLLIIQSEIYTSKVQEIRCIKTDKTPIVIMVQLGHY
jgi:hypothetical protein